MFSLGLFFAEENKWLIEKEAFYWKLNHRHTNRIFVLKVFLKIYLIGRKNLKLFCSKFVSPFEATAKWADP